MRKLIVPLSLVALCGCEQSLLRDFHVATMNLYVPVGPGDSTYDLSLDVPQDVSKCPAPLSARATVNGHPMALVDPGGEGYDAGSAKICSAPRFTLENAPAADEALVVIDDGKEQFRMRVLAPAVQRTWVAVPADTNVLTVGQQVTLQWTPATDAIQQVTVSFYPDDLAAAPDTAVNLDPSQVQANGTLITFTVPAPKAATRTGTLNIFASAKPAIPECSGPAQCNTQDLGVAVRAVTLQ